MNEFKNQPTEAGLVNSISKFVGRVTPKKLRTVLTSDVTKSVRGKCQGNKNNYKSDCGKEYKLDVTFYASVNDPRFRPDQRFRYVRASKVSKHT